MTNAAPAALQILFLLEAILFASVIALHLSKKNSSAVALYLVQSLAVVMVILVPKSSEASAALFFSVAAMLVVKVVVGPYFFNSLIKKHHLKFSASTYLNAPATLTVVTALTVFSFSEIFRPLGALSAHNETAVLLAIASLFISLFLIINRKGALSQMIGILSLENSIVSFAALSGLEQSPALQLGILFDIFVWIIIATVFAGMIFAKFGSLDASLMRQLKEE